MCSIPKLPELDNEVETERLFAARISINIRDLYSPKHSEALLKIIDLHKLKKPIEIIEYLIFMTQDTVIDKEVFTLTAMIDLRQDDIKEKPSKEIIAHVNKTLIELVKPHLVVH